MTHVLWSLLYANWSMYPDLATGTTWTVKEGKRSGITHQCTMTFCWPQKRKETRWNKGNQRLHQTARCTCKRSSAAWLPCFVEPTQLPFRHDQKPGWKANGGHIMRVVAHKWESHWNQKCQKWFFESWLSRSFRTFPTNRLLHFCTKAGPQSCPNCLSRLETRGKHQVQLVQRLLPLYFLLLTRHKGIFVLAESTFWKGTGTTDLFDIPAMDQIY